MIDLSQLSPRERLAAEQAILTVRALNKAGDAATQGQGMDYLEKVITDEGFQHLRDMLASAVAAREDLKKRVVCSKLLVRREGEVQGG